MFNDLVIFEMANNHQGRIDHAKKIIAEFKDKILTEKNKLFLSKFQGKK